MPIPEIEGQIDLDGQFLLEEKMILNLILEQEYFVGRFEIEIGEHIELNGLGVLMPETGVGRVVVGHGEK